MLADFTGTADGPSIASFTRDGAMLLAGRVTRVDGTSIAFFRPLVIDLATGATFAFPTALDGASALSRDGQEVLGQSGRHVVVERRDGTIAVLARDAHSASCTR